VINIKKSRKSRTTRSIGNLFFYLAIGIIIFACIFPYYWLVSSSIKPPDELSLIPPKIAPTRIDFSNYISVLNRSNFPGYIRNSFLISTFTSLLCVTLAAFAAYAIIRIRMKGYKIILGIILLLAMLPGIAVIAPLYEMFQSLRILNTYFALILPYVAFNLPFSIWYLANFFKSFPPDLEEAAMVDGCTPLQAMFKIMFPISTPGLISIAILSFIGAWNEFLFALTFTQTDAARTGVVGVMLFRGTHLVPWGQMTAAASIMAFPIIIVVLLGQKWLMRSVISGMIKG